MSTIRVGSLCFPSRHGCPRARLSGPLAGRAGSPTRTAHGRPRGHTGAAPVNGRDDAMNPRGGRLTVTVWVCPVCENYYASSGSGDLRTEWNHDNKGRPLFTRARCPDCMARGMERDRQPHRASVWLGGDST